jgi:hypothetical protein
LRHLGIYESWTDTSICNEFLIKGEYELSWCISRRTPYILAPSESLEIVFEFLGYCNQCIELLWTINNEFNTNSLSSWRSVLKNFGGNLISLLLIDRKLVQKHLLKVEYTKLRIFFSNCLLGKLNRYIGTITCNCDTRVLYLRISDEE